MHVGAASALGAATRAPRCPHAGKGTWRTSSYSGSTGGQCVEVASDAGVMVRDTTDRDGGTLSFGADAWPAFLTTIK
jgi:hypothetical protein